MVRSNGQELSERLKTIVQLVSPTTCVVDIGSDHGLVPLALMEKGKMDKVIAVEVAEGPFFTVKHAFECSVYHDRLEARFGDGLTPISQGEANGIVIAGMGGKMIWRILTGNEALSILHFDLPELVLQPMEDSGLVRFFASLTGYQVVEDLWIRDRGLTYNCMKLLPPTSLTVVDFEKAYRNYPQIPVPDRIEFDFGKAINRSDDAIFVEFLQSEILKIKGVIKQLERARSEEAFAKKNQWQAYLDFVQKIRRNIR